MSFVNEKELRVVGLSRSGLHAFIEWILHQCEGKHLLLNSTEGKADPFTTARPLGPGPGQTGWRSNDDGYQREDPDAARKRRRDLLLISHEDSYLGHAFSPWYERHHDELVGTSRERHDIVLVRDPFNLFASRRQSGVGLIPSRNAMRIWRQHARADDRTRSRKLPRRPLVVSYNRWFGDRAYRQELATALGLRFNDAGRNRVPTTFGGSSFDGTAYDGRPHKMRVFERWRHMVDDPVYRTLFQPDIIEIARDRFGTGPGAEEVEQAIAHFLSSEQTIRGPVERNAPSPAA